MEEYIARYAFERIITPIFYTLGRQTPAQYLSRFETLLSYLLPYKAQEPLFHLYSDLLIRLSDSQDPAIVAALARGVPTQAKILVHLLGYERQSLEGFSFFSPRGGGGIKEDLPMQRTTTTTTTRRRPKKRQQQRPKTTTVTTKTQRRRRRQRKRPTAGQVVSQNVLSSTHSRSPTHGQKH